MRRLFMFTVILTSLIINGCAYQDMNRVQFVTMSIFDRNEADEMVIYTELMSANRGTGRDLGVSKRIVNQATGSTLSEAYFNMQGSVSVPVAYDINKSIVFTEKIARQGLQDYIGGFGKNQSRTLRLFIFITESDPVEVVNVKLEEEEYIGVYLDSVMTFQKEEGAIISSLLNEYLNYRLMGSKVGIVPMIKISNKSIGERLDITGGAVLENDKMVEKLSTDEVLTYKILTNELKSGNITIQNPQEKGTLISLYILSGKTKEDIEIVGEEIVLNIKINAVYSIQAAQGEFDPLDDKVEERIIKLAEEDIKKRCTELFQKYKEKGIDLLNVEMLLQRQYPSEKLADVIERTSLNVDATVKLDGSQNNTYSK